MHGIEKVKYDICQATGKISVKTSGLLWQTGSSSAFKPDILNIIRSVKDSVCFKRIFFMFANFIILVMHQSISKTLSQRAEDRFRTDTNVTALADGAGEAELHFTGH